MNKIAWIGLGAAVLAVAISASIGLHSSGLQYFDSSDSSQADATPWTPPPVAVSATPTPTPTPSEAGISELAAMKACDAYGEANYPYGYKPHWILGHISDVQDGIGGRIENYKVSITNAFGATAELRAGCVVDQTGTVRSFDVG